MARYFIKLAYKGTNYHGWQIQQNEVTIQEVLEKALSTIYGAQIQTIGAGRTDTGVHAKEFYAHFEYNQPFKYEINELIYKINCILPEDIVIYNIFKVSDRFHARYDAISRIYKYYINKYKNPFNNEFSIFQTQKLHIKEMNEACKLLIGEKDFGAFEKKYGGQNNSICNVITANWSETNETYEFTIEANRFLRNMVRAIVGTIIEVGRGKMTVDEFNNVLISKNRSNAGTSIDAKGLFLYKINYNFNL